MGSHFSLITMRSWLLLCCFFSVVICSRESNVNYESKLYNELIFVRHIDRYSRPVGHHNDAVVVELALQVFDVMTINDQSEVLTFNGFMQLKWRDYNFTWDPQEYGRLKLLSVPDFFVWKPDIILLNNVQLKDDVLYRSWSYIRLHSNGQMEWNPPVTLAVRCPMDLRVFPFDEHVCRLKFASLNYLAEHLNITLGSTASGSNLDDVEPNEWQITNWSARNDYSSHLPRIEYEVRVRRRAPYYAYAIILPILVVLVASLAGFWLPPNAGEKITLNGFVALLLLVLLVHLYWVVPRSASGVPGIVVLCGNAMAFVGFSLVVSVVTITLSRSPHLKPTPSSIHSLLTGPCGRWLCLGASDFEHQALDNAVQENSVNKEWLLLATAIDRMCFIIYSISFVILAVACLS